MNTKERGELVEQRLILWFMERGYSVLTPVGDSDRYDFVVEDGGFTKVQAKKGWVDGGKVKFNARSTTSNRNENREKTYTDDEIDGFAVYCDETECYYWIPVNDVSGSRFSIRFEEAEVNHPSINWDDDYKLTERFK